MSNLTINKTYTANPAIDYLLYYSKLLAFNSVIKNEEEALQNETKQSMLNGDALIACIEGNAIFELFDYDEEILKSIGMVGDSRIGKCIEDRNNIPDVKESIFMDPVKDAHDHIIGYKLPDEVNKVHKIGDTFRVTTGSKAEAFRDYKVKEYADNKVIAYYSLRDSATQAAAKKFIRDYNEQNNYYRKLCGLPNIGDYGIPIMDYEYFDVNGIQEFINNEGITYVHELSHQQILYLEHKGILDQIKIDYPDADYLDYIACGLTPYKVRKAYEYQLLYTPKIDDNGVVSEKFETKYEENRLYVMSTLYSEALKIGSDYYTNFMGMMIMIMTITDILANVHEDIIKRDIFDKRFIQYIFEMYGIPYYNTIPLKYQWRMCKNINSLIRYKSCAQGMLNIIDLFGAENIQVFKYFILRDRNIDRWGDLIYNQMQKKSSNLNSIIKYEQQSIKNVMTGEEYPIPYPMFKGVKITNFTSNTNQMLLWYKNTPLKWGDDYTINNGKITFKKSGLNNATIDIDFYYNTEFVKPYIDTKHAIHTKVEKCIISTSGKMTLNAYKRFNPTYFADENKILLIIDNTPVPEDKYTIDAANSTITLNSNFNASNEATIVYIWGEGILSQFKLGSPAVVTGSGECQINSQVPFLKYFEKENDVVLMTTDIRPTIIPESDYTLNRTDKPGLIKFTNVAKYKNKKIVPYFIYSHTSVINNIQIVDSTETFTANTGFQVTFKLHPPFKNFFKIGYKAYVTLRNQPNMLSSDLYDIYNDTLTIRDQAIGLHKGQKMVVTYVGGPDNSNIRISSEKIVPAYEDRVKNRQFQANLPESNFFENKNAIIVDILGNYLRKDIDYTVSNTGLITIINPSKKPYKNQSVNITYVMNNYSKDMIELKQTHVVAGKLGQTEFDITAPFINYVETGQSALVFHNSDLLSNDYKLTNTKLTLTGGDVVKKDDAINIIWVYNNRYEDVNETAVYIKHSNPIAVNDVNNDLQIKVPYPFDKFEENGWYTYVTYSDGTLIPDNEYDIISGYFTFRDVGKHNEDKKIIFHFVYLQNERFVFDTIEEDYTKDIDMKFIGVPIEDEYFNKNIIKKTNVLSYDTVTIEDSFWDGVGYSDDTAAYHQKIKREILAKKFNYERTKYFGLNYVFNIAEMTFNICYFYNIFFDDVFKEDKLKVQVPSIVPYKSFNVAYLFTYMNALSYLYSGVEDTIINTLGKILYVRGFNFKADMGKLKEWIWEQRRDPDNFDTTFIYSANKAEGLPNNRTNKVWKFDIKPGENNVFESMNEIADMFRTGKKKVSNKDIYQFIVANMFRSQNVDIYKIWKKLFDSLMTYRQTFDYYKIKVDGKTRIANSLSEFLKYKDHELYTDYMQIKNISDKTMRNEKIVERISDIVYILEEYINSDLFRNIFDHLPGISGNFFLDMLFTIITFFKSYKIVLRSKSDYIIFDATDPYMNTLKYIDCADTMVRLNKHEYISRFRETTTMDVSTHYYDHLGFKEYIEQHRTIEDSINPKYIPYAKAHNLPTTNTIKVKVKVPKNQIITVYTSTGQVYTTNVSFGEINARNADQFTNKKLVTYWYTYKTDAGATTWQGFTMEGDKSYESFRFIPIDANHPTGFKSKDLKDNKLYRYTLDKPAIATEEYITFTLKYGEEFYAFLDKVPGYTPGRLNRRYGYAQDEDMEVYATDAVPEMEYVYVSCPKHVHITATHDDEVLGVDSSFEVITGTLVTFKVTVDPGYHADTTLIVNDAEINKKEEHITIDKSYKISAKPVIIETCTVRLVAPENETIRFIYDDKIVIATSGTTVEETVPMDASYIISVTSATAYKPGTLNVPSRGKMNSVTLLPGRIFMVTTTPATIRKYKVKIIQTPNQTIHAYHDGHDYTTEFTTTIYSKVQVKVIPELGYSAGRPVKPTFVITSDTEITAMEAKPNKYIVRLTAPQHESITFTAGSVSGTALAGETKELANILNGSRYNIKVIGDHGYQPGEPNISKSGTISFDMINPVTQSINITAEPATYKKFNIRIHQSPHQTITVRYNNINYTNSFMAPYGNQLTVSIVSTSVDYRPGNLNVSNTLIVSDDIDIEATPAIINKPLIKITKYDHQKIVATYNGEEYIDNFRVPVHANITARVESINDHYVAGAINMNEVNNITSDIILSASNAELRSYMVRIVQQPNQTIVVHCNSTDYDTVFMADSGTPYSITVTPEPGYKAGILNVDQTGYILKDMTITVSTAIEI